MFAGTEREIQLAMLAEQRSAVRRKCEGLDQAQLHARFEPSVMTLAGMMTHLWFVEDWWCTEGIAGRRTHWADVDWDADNDHDWHLALNMSGAELFEAYDDAIGRSDAIIASHDFDDPIARPSRDGSVIQVRWVIAHLIEEYARHAGHADLIRESIDGSTGQ